MTLPRHSNAELLHTACMQSHTVERMPNTLEDWTRSPLHASRLQQFPFGCARKASGKNSYQQTRRIAPHSPTTFRHPILSP